MSSATSNLTSGFIDLATYDEQEKYLYGGANSIAYFVREIAKATWFTQVPVVLSKASGTPQFNQEWAVQISRAGDYLLYAWLRVTIPSVSLCDSVCASGLRIRWTRNIMHNLLHYAQVTFNDLWAHKFDNYFLDFWAAFTVPEGKLNGYKNMIGTVPDLYQPKRTLPSYTLNLPLPFFFSRDTGVALPTAALPYNDMRMQFSFRNWSDLLIVNDTTAGITGYDARGIPPTLAQLGNTEPQLTNVQVWTNYAIVSNDERKRMACAPRDILIEQTQVAPIQTFTPSNPNQQFDIRFSHAVKVLFFAVRNKTCASEWSNYTSASPVCGTTIVEFNPAGAFDPISNVSLIYENTQRLWQIGSDYYSLVNPWYHAPVIPKETGYHMYSYSIAFFDIDPKASTNYGKLTNVSIIPAASAGAIIGATGGGATGSGYDYTQSYDFIIEAVNNNIIRISGGALGFPVL